MKQRFLNQKMGKRMSRKTGLAKAKALLPKANIPRKTGRKPLGPSLERIR